MDSSSVLQLNLFPADILGLMLSWSSTSYLFLDLWQCGNALLNSKLKSGVTHITLSSTCDRFPRSVQQLRKLRYLSISSSRKLFENRLHWRKMVDGLPSTVETLKFLSPDSILALMKYQDVSAVNYELMQYDNGSSRYVDLSKRLPQLHTLELKARLHNDDLPGLPSTLTKLTATSIKVSDRDSLQVASVLPRTLTYLKATIEYSAPRKRIADIKSDWAEAPPNLTFLEDVNLDGEDANILPRTLTGGDILGYYGIDFDCDLALALPPLLRVLCISSVDHTSFSLKGARWVDHLPTNLTTLSLRPSNLQLSPNDIHELPRSLTKFTCTIRVKHDWEAFRAIKIAADAAKKQVWPPNLLKLTIGSDIYLSQLELFPASVAHLSVSIAEEAVVSTTQTPGGLRSCLVISPQTMLPPKLRKLTINIRNPKADISFATKLPDTLKTLMVHRNAHEPAPLTLETFDMLPNSITKLLCDIPFNSDPKGLGAAPVALPKHLTYLEIRSWHRDWFITLPRGLTNLEISHLWGDTTTTSNVDMFASLPPPLTFLSLSSIVPSSIVFASSSLSTLRHLKHIRLPAIGYFPPQSLRNLPNTLISAVIRITRDSKATMLPKHLGMTYSANSHYAEIGRIDKTKNDEVWFAP